MPIFGAFILTILLFLPLSAQEQASEGKSHRWYDEISARLEMSNFSYESLKDELKIEFETEIYNTSQDKYIYDLTVSYEYDEDKDPYDHQQVIDFETDAEFTFQRVGVFHRKLNYSSLVRFHQEKNNGDNTDVYDIDFAPVGLKIMFYRSEIIRELSIDYLPVYNYHHYYKQLSEKELELTPGLVPKIERALHHTIKFVLTMSFFSDKIRLKNKMVYKQAQPFDKIEDNEDDYKDIIIDNEFAIRYYLTDYFSIGYKYEFNSDERRERTLHLPRINQINTLTLTFSWNGA